MQNGDLMPQTGPVWCTRCVMNGRPELVGLDARGHCRFCRAFDTTWPKYSFTEEKQTENLRTMAARVRARRGHSHYDAVVGLSGGVDSSYVALMASSLGLRVLAVHFDNGWNSRTAVENIRRIVDTTGFDLETYVIDWPEFRDLQRAYLLAGVVDIEALTDHAITAAMFGIARRERIGTVLSGSNFATEHGMPEGWSWHKQDWRNIKAIHRRFGERPLRSYPHLSSLPYAFIEVFGLGGRVERPLDLMNYRKEQAMEELRKEFGWEYYGGKHYESTWTKFYQAYILPVKFGVDKRPVHLSAQVRIGEIGREEAYQTCVSPLYDRAELDRDKRFVCSKLGFQPEELDRILSERPKPHDAYPTDLHYMRFARDAFRILGKVRRAFPGGRKSDS